MDDEQTGLAHRESASLADPYERKYMAGDGTVLYRDRMVAGKKFNGFLVAVAAFMIGYPLAVGAPLTAILPSLPVLAFVWIFFGVLRTTVSQGTVNISYGLFGPKIPVASIESVQRIDYDWKAFGGWGIRRGREGWMYNMMGDGGRAVRIEWRTESGKRKVTFVGTKTADALAEAIEVARQRGALPAGGTPAIGPSSDDD